MKSMSKRIKLETQTIYHWFVLEYVKNHQNHSLYRCRCRCGVIKLVSGNYLRAGKSQSCGCEASSKRKAAALPHRKMLSDIHHAMMQRCYHAKHPSYLNYGGRKIIVHAEWHKLNAFYDWAIEHGYSPALQLNRINNNGDYGPENCNWVTRKENMRNTRRTRRYTLDGINPTAMEMAEFVNIGYEDIRSKLRRGWTAEEVLRFYGKTVDDFATYYKMR